jgi:hypothetical protein
MGHGFYVANNKLPVVSNHGTVTHGITLGFYVGNFILPTDELSPSFFGVGTTNQIKIHEVLIAIFEVFIYT